MNNYNRLPVLLLSAALLLPGGCSVTPKPIENDALATIAVDRMAALTASQEPVTKPIDLYEAMARAIKYNLDYRVELLEQTLRSKELSVARAQMLPQLVANAGYLGRDNDAGGRSRLIESPYTESLNYSTSQQREHNTAELSLSWNVLDFGLSYVRAQQRADEVLIALEQRRKIANRIIEDVRTAYWRAVSSERLVRHLQALESEVDRSIRNADQLISRSKTSPIKALSNKRELMNVKLQIRTLHKDYAMAKHQLAALINIGPGESFQLADTKGPGAIPAITRDPDTLYTYALTNRPEIREINYRQRINHHATKAALLEALPGIRLSTGYNWDSNDYYYHQHWRNWGTSIGWNLMNAFRYPLQRQKDRAERQLLQQQGLATAMAIVTQVHISLAKFEVIQDELRSTKHYLDLQQQIDQNLTRSLAAGRISAQQWIRERMNTVVARTKYDIAYAELQNAYANIYASIGMDAFPADVDGSENVRELSHALRHMWLQRQATHASADRA